MLLRCSGGGVIGMGFRILRILRVEDVVEEGRKDKVEVKGDAGLDSSPAGEKNVPGASRGVKNNDMIDRLKDQNDRLKEELKMLTGKLEEFVEKAKIKKHQKLDMKRKVMEDENVLIQQKKDELEKLQNKITRMDSLIIK